MGSKPVIVGLAPTEVDPRPLPPDSRVGWRLAWLIGLAPGEYGTGVDRLNLHAQPGAPGARDVPRAMRTVPRLLGRRVVFLGRRVAAAFGHSRGWCQWHLANGYVAMVVPHPSGRSRVWNDPRTAERVGDALFNLTRPCVHVEGPDGAGKSTTAVKLARALGCPTMETHGPPATGAESWRLLDERLGPWRVVDRSTGLISEIVYGPIVRGRTVVPLNDLWDAVSALKNVVTFVYCRPPMGIILRHGKRGRPGEDSVHVAAVSKNLTTIVCAYDETMDRVARLGCRVVEHDWTNDPLEQAVADICAE